MSDDIMLETEECVDDDERDRSLASVEVPINCVRPKPDHFEEFLSTSLSDHHFQFLQDEQLPAYDEPSSSSRTVSDYHPLKRAESMLPDNKLDYSKVESKVKHYISEIRQQSRKRQPPKRVALELTENQQLHRQIDRLKQQLNEKDCRIAVLQDEFNQALLHNASLRNVVDELRMRLHRRPSVERFTNSPPLPDSSLSSLTPTSFLIQSEEDLSVTWYQELPLTERGPKECKQSSPGHQMQSRSTQTECRPENVATDWIRDLRKAADAAIAVRDQSRFLLHVAHVGEVSKEAH